MTTHKRCTQCGDRITGDELCRAMDVEDIQVRCGCGTGEILMDGVGGSAGTASCPDCKGTAYVNANAKLHAHMLDNEPLCEKCYEGIKQTFEEEGS